MDYVKAAELLFRAENPRLVQLSLFFSVKEHIHLILPLFSNKKKHITKTLIEWTIIKFARMCPLEYEWENERINIADEYTTFRAQGTKEHSDPFCRKPRSKLNNNDKSKSPQTVLIDNVKFDFVYDSRDPLHSKSIETTEAQLTFLKWTIVRGILQYIQSNVVRLNELYVMYGQLRPQYHDLHIEFGDSHRRSIHDTIRFIVSGPHQHRKGKKCNEKNSLCVKTEVVIV